ncbi:MAG TPA: hypothetical protein VMG12_41785 [Polyangiaceae bacterium]|nr:hypothetical protein [Polyangiaceae bacterium]
MTASGARVSSRAAACTAAAMLLAAVGQLACGASDAVADRGDEAGTEVDPGAGSQSPQTPAPSEPSTDEPPAAGDYPGTYFVPVPLELEPYALFDLESVRVELRGDELGIQYDLPELLLGEQRRIAFRGSATAAGEYRLEGDDGVATCRSTRAGRWTCDEVLSSIQFDANKLDRLLASMPDTEARARRRVSDRFTIDPIGVLEVELGDRP